MTVLHRQFLSEIEKAKEKARENGSPYDCIVGLSGGKDGAYLICQLKKVIRHAGPGLYLRQWLLHGFWPSEL